jgi:DNA invertase Pin-like site-specific DNA recombinase
MKRTNNGEARSANEGAFVYLRVSDPSQLKGDGFARQLKACEEYAKANGLTIVQVYKEEGISGTLERRPALAELIVSLKQNGHGIKTVIIEKLDRLARDYMVQEFIIRDFTKQGFNIISTMEGKDLCGDDPTRKLIRTIMGGFAEYEKTMICAKLKAARDRIKQRTGKCEGRKGYAETEQGRAICDRIVELRNTTTKDRPTFQKISEILNAEGILTLDGKPWSLYRVQQTLSQYKH